MSKYYSHLNSAKEVIHQYGGQMPLSQFLKRFFQERRQMGSKDRKQVSQLCYNYFRLYYAIQHIELEKAILLANMICSDTAPEIVKQLMPHWLEQPQNIMHLFENRYSSFDELVYHTFPFKTQLSNKIDFYKMALSVHQQPMVFFRRRTIPAIELESKLHLHDIAYLKKSNSCYAVSNGAKLEQFFDLNHEILIQDYSSQTAIKQAVESVEIRSGAKIWDCCAASGGKSIFINDHLQYSELLVSDVRASILNNLKERFKQAGLKNYKSLLLDLTLPLNQINDEYFDLILADVPCSGSGTWARTPEQLAFFEEGKLAKYQGLQRGIITNVIPKLQKGGRLVYMTCSVFAAENEDNVTFIVNNIGLELIQSTYALGYEQKADTMFWAVFTKK